MPGAECWPRAQNRVETPPPIQVRISAADWRFTNPPAGDSIGRWKAPGIHRSPPDALRSSSNMD